MNKIASILLVVLCLGILISAKAQSHTAVRSFGPGLCDSIKEVSKEYYASHQKRLTILDTTGIPIKEGSRFYVKFGKDSLLFEDAPSGGDRSYFSKVVGMNPKTGWILVIYADEMTNTYFLIDQKRVVIDTLIGYPYFYKDKIICLEAPYTDWPGRIEIRELKNDTVKIFFKDNFSRCNRDSERGSPEDFVLSINNEFMFYSWGKYWIVKGALF